MLDSKAPTRRFARRGVHAAAIFGKQQTYLRRGEGTVD